MKWMLLFDKSDFSSANESAAKENLFVMFSLISIQMISLYQTFQQCSLRQK